MESMPAPTVGCFSEEVVRDVIASLPPNPVPDRLAVLPWLLREWHEHFLPYHFGESRATIRARQKRLRAVARYGEKLFEALVTLDDSSSSFELAIELAIHQTGKSLLGLTQSDIAQARERLSWGEQWLRGLAEACGHSADAQPVRRGRPTDVLPYLVMLDLEAIFEFVTGTRAERRVRGEDHPDYGKEYGPFWDFVRPTWMMIFGSNAGLSAAMKDWSLARNKFGEVSAIIANIAMRRPEWRIFG
jgi:hypothetical protein